ALAQASLHRVDLQLERAIYQDEQEEGQAEGHQIGDSPHLEARKEVELAVRSEETEEARQLKSDCQKPRSRVRRIEPLSLDRAVYDGLGEVERQEIRYLRDQDERQDEQLFAPTISKYVFEKIGFHDDPQSRGEPWDARPARHHDDRTCSR